MKTQLALPLAVVVVVVLAFTWAHGVMTERFGFLKTTSATLNQFTERVPEIPLTIGSWVGSEEEVDPVQFKLTNCTKCVQRHYRNRDTGQAVDFYLVSGSGRNITIHTPDWCYRAVGYIADSEPVQYRMAAEGIKPDPEFATAVFRKHDEQSGLSQILRIFWTYSADGVWTGPKWAKLVLTRRNALYKIYLICRVEPNSSAAEKDSAAPAFVKDCFPTINAVLFQDESSEAAEPVADST